MGYTGLVSENPENTTQSIVPTRHDADRRDRRLQRTLAWVGIVAGVVFTVAVIFFSGLALGRASDGHHGWNRGYQGGQMGPGGCPMMGGMTGEGRTDGMGGPGMMRPGQQSPAPSASAPPQR